MFILKKPFTKSFSFLNFNIVKAYARNVLGDNIIPHDKTTLTGRLFLYLNPKTNTQNQNSIESKTDKDNINIFKKGIINTKLLHSLSNDSLPTLIKLLEDKALIANDTDFYKLLFKIDTDCCRRIKALNKNESFAILDAFCDLVPNRITELKFYHKCIQNIMENKNELNNNEIIKTIFYIGLMKKARSSSYLLKECFLLFNKNNLEQLKLEDFCIIANSAYKTSTKLSNTTILKKIIQKINDDLKILNDPSLFITLIKVIRFHRFQNEDLLQTISFAVFFNKCYINYSFSTYCHILAMYADFLYYDEKLLKIFCKECIKEIKQVFYKNNKLKFNDLKRFLWAISNLNCTFIDKNDLESVMRCIRQNEKDIKNDLLIDTVLYFWILNYRPYDLLNLLAKERDKILESLTNKPNNLRLNFLLTCIYFEERNLFNKLDLKPQGKADFVEELHLKNRPVLNKVLNNLKILELKLDMKFELGYQIPYCNILGIIGYTKNIYKTVNIEVLDDFTSLKNTEFLPTGHMQVKLRILENMEEALLLINSNDVEKLTETEIKDFLIKELKFIC